MFICEKGFHSIQELLTFGESKKMLHLQAEFLSKKWGALQVFFVLEEIVERYPGSPDAGEAKLRLEIVERLKKVR